MYPTTGFTHELSQAEQNANELATVREIVRLHPDNAYWRSVLIAVETKTELARDAEWLRESPELVNSTIDPREPWQIEMDEAGQDQQAQITELRGG